MTIILRTFGLFVVTATAEILGCYMAYVWLKQRVSGLVLVPAGLSLATFAYLLSIHPGPTGRTYAAYGGVYVSVALLWLWLVDGQWPDRWDVIGAVITVAGMSIIAFAPRMK